MITPISGWLNLPIVPEARADWVSQCPDSVGSTIGVGEARYSIRGSSSASNQQYANAYFDGGAELSITSTYPAGYAAASSTYYVGFATSIEVVSGSNCGNVYITLRLYDNGGGGCSKGTYLSYAQHKVDTCGLGTTGGNDDLYFGTYAPALGMTGPGTFYYEVTVSDIDIAPTLRATDSGCFKVSNSSTLCY